MWLKSLFLNFQKRQSTVREKILTNDTSNKELIFKIYKKQQKNKQSN